MKTIVSVLIAAVVLAGCAQTLLVKDGATGADFDKDLAQCEYEANSSVAGYSTGPTNPTMGGSLGQGFGEGLYKGLEVPRLMKLCMKAKGWREQPTA